MPKWRQTGQWADRRSGRLARLRAGLVVGAVVLAPATALLAAGVPLTTPAAAETDPQSQCVNPSSTLPPDSPTSLPFCDSTTTTTVPPTTTTTKPTTNTTKPKSTTTTTTTPSSDQGGQQGSGD